MLRLERLCLLVAALPAVALAFAPSSSSLTASRVGHGTQPVASVTDGTFLYAALYGSGEVIKIEPSSGEIVARLDVGPTPKAMAMHGSRLLVTRFMSTASEGAVYIKRVTRFCQYLKPRPIIADPTSPSR